VRQISALSDERSVGIGFVDVLFALVIGKVLASVGWNGLHQLTRTELANLGVATVITLASWIGYHNSYNRPKFKIRFFNLPLAQFSLDIMMVFVYWLLASVATSDPLSRHPAAVTAGLVFVTFVLYVLWDLVGILIGAQEKPYQKLLQPVERWKGFQWDRYVPTWIATTLAFVLWRAAVANPGPRWSYLVDVLLVCIALGFRVAKDIKPGNRTEPRVWNWKPAAID
jgi:hypothetical protein